MKITSFTPSVLLAALVSVALAAPSPAPQAPQRSRPGALIPHQHDIQDVQIDLAIVSALERLFQNGGLQVDGTSGVLSLPDYSALEARSMAITPDELIKRQAIATRNDLINGLCAEIVIIYARGTSGEGNLGAALGPTFINQVAAAKPGKVIGQGVLPYAATVLGYLAGGDPTGANSMVTLIQRANTQCPGSKIVLGGYSQGAQVVHLAVGKLATTLYSKIAAIVTFGDPKRDEAFPTALQSKALVICNDGDLICDGLPIILGPHGAAEYEKRLSEAVSFVVSKV